MFGWIRVVYGLPLTLFLPGYAVTKAAYPRGTFLDDRYPGVATLGLSLALSLVITVLWAFVLDILSRDGNGLVRSPYIEAGLVTVTLGGLVVAWWRGAFPWLRQVSPRLLRPLRLSHDHQLPLPQAAAQTILEYEELLRQRSELRGRRDDLGRRIQEDDPALMAAHRQLQQEVTRELEDVEKAIRVLEEAAGRGGG